MNRVATLVTGTSRVLVMTRLTKGALRVIMNHGSPHIMAHRTGHMSHHDSWLTTHHGSPNVTYEWPVIQPQSAVHQYTSSAW